MDAREIKRTKVVNVRGLGHRYEVIYDIEKCQFSAYKLAGTLSKYGYPTYHRERIGVTGNFAEAVQMIADEIARREALRKDLDEYIEKRYV